MSETSMAMGAARPAALSAAASPAYGQVEDFVALLKPRVMSLVVFSGFAGLVVAPGEIHPLMAIVAILCIGVSAGASGAINMWYERDIDSIMSRTRMRPLPRGRVSSDDALAFGIVLGLFSVMLMGLAVNWTAALLLAAAMAFYIFVYTIWLKRRTPQNIVIGGAAGAFPPMIGWAAVTGSVSLESIVLFMIIFMWTPPHFWALALYKDGDYAKAGVPMLPVVAGKSHTKRQMLGYSLALVPLSAVPAVLGTAGWIYGATALLLSGLLVSLNLKVLKEEGNQGARQMFAYSILYLFLLFTVMILDAAPGSAAGSWWIW